MNRFLSPLKLGVFYDGNFLLHTSNYYNYFHSQRSRLSISGLHSYITKRVAEEAEYSADLCQIVEAHYFRGRINAVEASQRGNQLYNDRVFEDILMAEGIHTHYLPLRNSMSRKQERGIEVWLSLEVLEYAMAGKIDVAVLIVSDTDYAPLLRKLRSLGIRVVLLSWEFDYVNEDGVKVVTKTSHELLQLANYPILMYEEIEDGLKHNEEAVISLFVDNDPSVDIDHDALPEQSEVLSLKNGFGFVKYPNNNLYFHMQDVQGDFYDLMIGDAIEFTVGKNQQRQDVAKNIKKIYHSNVE